MRFSRFVWPIWFGLEGNPASRLDPIARSRAQCGMPSPTEQNFLDYKQAERKALEIVAAMKATTPKRTDIELALLVAIFELHKGSVPAETVGAIIQGHLKTLLPFYGVKPPPTTE